MIRRTGPVVLLVTILALLAGVVFVSRLARRTEIAVAGAEAQRHESTKLAGELRQSSDDLTRMARTYVVTGDSRYKEYFQKIVAIRDGLVPRPIDYSGVYWDFVSATGTEPDLVGDAVTLGDLMRRAGFSADEINLLRRAKAESDDLARIEERAISAIEGQFPDAEGTFTVIGEPDPALARDLLHGKDYHQAKAAIMEPIDDFYRLVEARTTADIHSLRQRAHGLRTLGFVLLVGAALIVALGVVFGLWQVLAGPRGRGAGDMDNTGAASASSDGDASLAAALPIILAAVTVAVSIAALSWWVHHRFEQQLLEDLATDLTNVVNSNGENLARWISDREDEAHAWANQDEVRNDLRTLLDAMDAERELETLAVQDLLHTLFRPLMDYRSYDGFLLVAPNGIVLSSDRDELVGEPVGDRVQPELLQAFYTGPREAAVQLLARSFGDNATGVLAMPSMSVLAAIRDVDHRTMGVLVLELDPREGFSRILQGSLFGETGESYAFNHSGEMISESRFNDQLRSAGLLELGQSSTLTIEIRNPGVNLVKGHRSEEPRSEQPLTRMARSAIDGESGVDVTGYLDYRGVPVVGAWAWETADGYGIATEIDIAEVLEPLEGTRHLAFVGAAFSVVMVLALTAVFLWNRIRMTRTQAELRALVDRVQHQAAELEGVRSVILRWGPDGAIRFINDFGCFHFGFSSDQLVGQRMLGTIVEDTEEARYSIRRMIDEIADEPGKWETDESENRRSSGEIVWTAWRNQPILNPDGSLKEILTIGIDITQRRLAEEKVEEQRKLLENTLESLTHPFYVVDTDDYSLKVANSAARRLGSSGETTCHALTHRRDTPCDGSEHPCPMVTIKKTGQPTMVEHIHYDENDEPRYVEVHGYPVFDDDGIIIQMIEYSLDITKRKEFEEQLKQSEERIRSMVSNMPGVVYRCLMDENWTMLFVSDEIRNLSGYPAEDFLGENPVRTFASIMHPDDVGPIALSSKRAVEARKPYTNEYRVINSEGETRWVFARGQATCDEDGAPLYLDGTIFDVSDKKEMQFELEDAKEAAEAANRAKSAFLANMSHELRTPMNAIIGYSEMLAEEAEDDGLDAMIPDLGKINAAGKHLLALINDILDLSKIEAGRVDLYLERFELEQMLNEAVATVSPLVTNNDNELVIDFADDLGLIRADLTKLRQAIFNLLSNAAKFTKDGTVTLTAERQRREIGDWILLSVSDTGIGIPADKLDHVFEEFSQADDSTTRNFGGTGLGLPISRRFCRMMGGDITVKSDPGKGSTFTIELPAAVDALEAAKTMAGKDEKSERPIPEGIHPILVIDDDPDSRELLQRTLEADGYVVATAISGDEGLKLARELSPALITLDVMMPGMDGWAVLQRLKSDPVLAEIPVMMVTISGEKEMASTLGAVEHLTKPVDRDTLRRLAAQYAAPDGGGHALVVDDDESIRALFRRALDDDGWTVAEAANGAEALERVRECRPNIVLLDLMMPVMDGFDFLVEFRARMACVTTPVIVVTAKDLTEEDRSRLSGGVDRIVEKGALTASDLLEHIHSLVGNPGGLAGNDGKG